MLSVTLGGVPLHLSLRYPAAAAYFSRFLSREEERPSPYPPIRVSEADWAFWARTGGERNAYAEFSSLSGACSDVLLTAGRCAFHAVAIRCRNAAWLLAAPSGVGKTTLSLALRELCPEEVSVICGDRPILELSGEESVFVHPSPWNGKENIYGAEGAPLAGLVFLRRGEENRLERLTPQQAALLAYYAVIHTGETERGVANAAAFTTELLKRAPACLLLDRDVEGSVRLLHDLMFEEQDCR